MFGRGKLEFSIFFIGVLGSCLEFVIKLFFKNGSFCYCMVSVLVGGFECVCLV